MFARLVTLVLVVAYASAARDHPQIVTLAQPMSSTAVFNLHSDSDHCMVVKPGHLGRSPFLAVTPHCSQDQAAVPGTKLSFYRKPVQQDPSHSEFYLAVSHNQEEKCLYVSPVGHHLRFGACSQRSLRFVERMRPANKHGRGARWVLQTVDFRRPLCLTAKGKKVALTRCGDKKHRKAQLNIVA